MRDDDPMLNQVAALVVKGDTTRADYHRLWDSVMAHRGREFAAALVLPACGHALAHWQRRWVDGEATDLVVCGVCTAETEAPPFGRAPRAEARPPGCGVGCREVQVHRPVGAWQLEASGGLRCVACESGGPSEGA